MSEDVVLYRELESVSDKKIAIATLNAEKSLNALSLPMAHKLLEILQRCKQDPAVVMVIIEGAGEKAFCAGGDIRQLYQAMKDHPGEVAEYVEQFFTAEYQLDHFIHTFDKPIMCWGNGIVMGGGLGIMAGASHKVVTETSRIAMPEITIGLYPDVGGSYFLNHMPTGCGLFLGLTGASINATDAKFVGLADSFVPANKKQDVLDALLTTSWGDNSGLNHQKLSDVLHSFENKHRGDLPAGNIKNHLNLIEPLAALTSADDVAQAILAVESDDKWLSRAQSSLRHGSPITANIVFQQLQRGKSMSLADCFRMELGLSVKCSELGEFAEGVRALLIEKDNAPKWKFAHIADVDATVIDDLFTSPWSDETHPLKHLG